MDEEIKLKFAEMQAVIDALKAGVKRRPCHERKNLCSEARSRADDVQPARFS